MGRQTPSEDKDREREKERERKGESCPFTMDSQFEPTVRTLCREMMQPSSAQSHGGVVGLLICVF